MTTTDHQTRTEELALRAYRWTLGADATRDDMTANPQYKEVLRAIQRRISREQEYLARPESLRVPNTPEDRQRARRIAAVILSECYAQMAAIFEMDTANTLHHGGE